MRFGHFGSAAARQAAINAALTTPTTAVGPTATVSNPGNNTESVVPNVTNYTPEALRQKAVSELQARANNTVQKMEEIVRELRTRWDALANLNVEVGSQQEGVAAIVGTAQDNVDVIAGLVGGLIQSLIYIQEWAVQALQLGGSLDTSLAYAQQLVNLGNEILTQFKAVATGQIGELASSIGPVVLFGGAAAALLIWKLSQR